MSSRSLGLAPLMLGVLVMQSQAEERPRVRDVGVKVGILTPGRHNTITDVSGVKVGHSTLIEGDDVRTGVTAILPHGKNVYFERVPAAVHVGNGFGKFVGTTQIDELGEVETPILLTSTLNVPRVADALLGYMLGLEGMDDVKSVNPVVGETNDGQLNDIRARPLGKKHALEAIRNVKGGPVAEGCVGAGTGTICFGYKGGIGTSSRKLPANMGGYTIGVLVQTNFGGVLQIAGAPLGKELGRWYLKRHLDKADEPEDKGDGSVIIVVATDAPLDARNLKRLAARGMLGLGRTGAVGSNGSGDYVLTFSTAEAVRIRPPRSAEERFSPRKVETLPNEGMSPLFVAAIEATEEAIYNSMFRATTMTGNGKTVEALPLPRTVEILKKYGVIDGGK